MTGSPRISSFSSAPPAGPTGRTWTTTPSNTLTMRCATTSKRHSNSTRRMCSIGSAPRRHRRARQGVPGLSDRRCQAGHQERGRLLHRPRRRSGQQGLQRTHGTRRCGRARRVVVPRIALRRGNPLGGHEDACLYPARRLLRAKINDDFVRPKGRQGVSILASSGRKTKSYSTPDGSSTVFTRALVDVLRRGEPEAPPLLTLEQVCDLVRREIHDRGWEQIALPEDHSPQPGPWEHRPGGPVSRTPHSATDVPTSVRAPPNAAGVPSSRERMPRVTTRACSSTGWRASAKAPEATWRGTPGGGSRPTRPRPRRRGIRDASRSRVSLPTSVPPIWPSST